MIERARSIAEFHAQDIVQDLDFAIINAKLLNSLICDILDYSLFKENKMRLSCNDFIIDDTLKEVLDLISFQALHKGIELCLKNECEPNALINSDERRVKQVLINLLSNALKFTPEGGKIALRVSSSSKADVLKFEVMVS